MPAELLILPGLDAWMDGEEGFAGLWLAGMREFKRTWKRSKMGLCRDRYLDPLLQVTSLRVWGVQVRLVESKS